MNRNCSAPPRGKGREVVLGAENGSGWITTAMGNVAQPLTHILSGYLIAFCGAGFARVAAGLAFGDLWPLLAFLLAIPADHSYHLGQMAGVLGIDRSKRI